MMKHNRPFWLSLPLFVIVAISFFGSGGIQTKAAIDDKSASGVPVQRPVDFNGDGKSDWAVVRNTGGGQFGQVTWFVQENSGPASITYFPWGLAVDFFVPEDYDGDGKTDIAVWRPGPAGVAAWYIFQSGTNSVRAETFGQFQDDPTVVADYDGDLKADLAVYREGGNGPDPSFWFYRTTANGPIFARQWGMGGDSPAPGDYDGDAKNDFAVRRGTGITGQTAFWLNYAAAAPGEVSRYAVFGTTSDLIVTGDYDGDGKTDIAVARNIGGSLYWFYEPSSASGTFLGGPFGISSTDTLAQADYDGDGKTDFAVWRLNPNPAQNFFYVRRSSDGSLLANEWGQNGDYPVANYNTH